MKLSSRIAMKLIPPKAERDQMGGSSEAFSDLIQGVGWFVKAIGIAIGVAASLRVISEHIGADLGPVVELWVSTYRSNLYPIVEVLWIPFRYIFHLELLPIAKDCVTIYLLSAAANARGLQRFYLQAAGMKYDYKPDLRRSVKMGILWPFYAAKYLWLRVKWRKLPPGRRTKMLRYSVGMEVLYVVIATTVVVFLSLAVERALGS